MASCMKSSCCFRALLGKQGALHQCSLLLPLHCARARRSQRPGTVRTAASESWNSDEKFTSLSKGARRNSDDLTDADALASSLEEVASVQGRKSERTNMVLGADRSVEKWRELDDRVNEYPQPRTFKAVGLASTEFRDSMVAAVASVVGGVHQECVEEVPSAGGKYVSVRIGPVLVTNADEVIAVYARMKEDPRVRYMI